MEISDSDDDDCQLYTRTKEHFNQKRNEIEAKRRKLELDENSFSTDNDLSALGDDRLSFTRTRPIENEEATVHDNRDRFQDSSDTDDEIPIAVLSRALWSQKKTSPQKRSRKRCRNQPIQDHPKAPASQEVRNLGVIVLDDDSGYTVGSHDPIDFNSRSYRKRISSSNVNESIRLDSDSEEETKLKECDLVTLTIEWNNGHKLIRKEFQLRRYQKLGAVFEELAKMENISTSRVLLMYDFKSVSPMDTPSSLNLKFYGAFLGSISATEINHNKVRVDDEQTIPKPSGGINVKLLLQSKQTLLFNVSQHDKMDILYLKCAEELKCEQCKLRLTFDGEYVGPNENVSELDIEDGDVFHVYIKNQ